MDHPEIEQKLIDSIGSFLKEAVGSPPYRDLPLLVHQFRDEIVDWYVNRLIQQVESVLDIDPLLSEEQIFQVLGKKVAEFLGADFARIRVYDPRGEKGAYSPGSSFQPEDALEKLPFERTIADEVLNTQRSFFVPNIEKEPKFENKEKAKKLRVHSMLAIPISLPRFSIKDADTQGVLQIFYKKEDKALTSREVQVAEMLSRRVGYVIARKRIVSLQKMNVTRDKILEDIYLRLAKREGIKMKDVFNSVIPELADIMKIQRCTLFSVMEDRMRVTLEAGFPETEHGIGKVFSTQEPYIQALIQERGPFGDFENEKIHPSYILIHQPQKSVLLPPHLKHYLETQRINCVLYIPLHVEDTVQYFLAFDAQAHHQRFGEEEVMMFTFLGKELMKGLRLEQMDNILHDFKNPAIAIAGFARRIKRMIEEEGDLPQKEKIHQALDIVYRESCRLQELALTLHGEGKESLVDLTDILKRRSMINQEAMQELKRKNIHVQERQIEFPLWIRCYPLHIERVLDNLLNNACQAMPEGGGLSIQCYRRSRWAVAEITNTGEISAEEKERCLLGESRGRGLHITSRLLKNMGGQLEVETKEGNTTFRIELPLADPQTFDQPPSKAA